MQLRAIHVFPVKAMAGQACDAWPYDEGGLLGDRGWAVLAGDGRLGTGKDGTRFRRYDEIFSWAARLDAPGITPSVSCAPAGLRRTPADDPRVAEALRERFGPGSALDPGVRLQPLAATPFAEDDRGLKDSSPISLVGTATLAALGELLHTGPVDPRHLRANLVVDTTEAYVEDSWVGAGLRIGGSLFDVTQRITRCRMVDLAQADVAELPGLLKATGARGAKAAVYLRPHGTGRLTVGDRVVPG